MSDTGDLTAKIGIDASVTGAESVSALTAGIGGLSQQLLQLSQSAIQNTNVQAQLNSVLKATRSSVGVLGSSIAIYRKELALSNSMVRQNTASLLALDAAQKKVAASGKMTSSLSSSYAQTASHLNSMNSSVGTLNKTMRSNAIESFGKRLQQSGIQSQRVGMQMARNVTLPLIGIFRTAFFSYTRLEREQVRLTKLISDGFGTGADAIVLARKAVDELNPALDKITRKFGTSRILVQSLAGDFAELGVPTNAITDLTLLTVQLEKLGNLDIGQSQQFIQSIYQNILRVKRDSAEQQGFVFDITNAEQMSDTIEQLRGQLAIFNLMENKTTLSLKDIADAFPEMSAAATSFGLSMSSTASMLVPMVAAGFQVGASANSIKVSLQRMVAMTKQNTGIIRELNSALGPEFNLAAGVGMETIQKLTDGFNTLLSVKGEQGTLELFSRLFGVRQGPRMETSIRQFAQFQKALETTGSAESAIAKELEDKVNFRLRANGMEEVSLKKILDLTNLNRDSVEKVNGVYSKRAVVIQDAQKEATDSLGNLFNDTKDFISKVGTESGKGFLMEAVGGAAYAGKQMEIELQMSIDTAATRFDTLRESLMGIGRAIVPVVDVVVKAILPIVQKVEDFFKGLSATTRKFIGAFMGLALIIPMVSLLSSTFKTLFGGAIKGFGRMFMSTNGLFASLKGVKSQLVDIADIIIDPKMAKGFNSMVQYGDQALLSQDPSKAGYSTKLRGRRKMTPDLSGVDQPVRELIERGGMSDPNSLASIKSTLRGADKLGLPNTQELLRSFLTEMEAVPEKIAKASTAAVDKTAKTIAKTLKGTVFQNNTFVGNKFGGGAPGTTPGTTPGPRTPKSPAGGGTPAPLYPTPTGAPITTPAPLYPTPTGAPIVAPKPFYPTPTGRLPIPSAAAIAAPIAATVETAQDELEALGASIKDFTETVAETPKPARTRTPRTPRAPPVAPVETPVDSVKPAPKPRKPRVSTPKVPRVEVTKEVKKAAEQAIVQIENTVDAITDASAGATASVEKAAKNVGKAAKVTTKTAKVATGQGAKVILTYKEITDFFTAAGQQLPEEYDFIRTVDREIALTKKAKTDFFKNLSKEFEKKSTTPLGKIDRGKYRIFGDAARNAPSIQRPAYLPVVDQLLTDRLTPSVSGQKLGATQKSSLLNSRSQMLQGVADVSGVSKYDAAKAAKAQRKIRDAQSAANAIAGNIADSAPGITPPSGVEEVYTTRPKAEIAAIEKSLAEAKSNLKIVEKEGTDVARQLGGTYRKQINDLQEELLLAKSAIHEKLVPASKATSQLLTAESNLMREEMAIQNLTSGRTASGSGIGPDNPIRYANELSDRVGGMERVVSQKGSPVALHSDIRAKILHDLEIEKLTQKILDSTDENIIRDLKSRMAETADDILDSDVNLSGSDGNRKATAAELKKVKKETARRMAERKGVDLTKYLPTSDEFDPSAEAAILKNKKVVSGVTEFYKGIGNGGDELVAELADMKKDVAPARISSREKLAKAFIRQREAISPAKSQWWNLGSSGRTAQPIRNIVSGGMGDLPTGAGVGKVATKGGKKAAAAVKDGLVKISTLVDKSIDDLVDQLPISKFSKVEKDIIRQVAKATIKTTPAGAAQNMLQTGVNLMKTKVDEAAATTIKASLDGQVSRLLNELHSTPILHKSDFKKTVQDKLAALFRGTKGSVAKFVKSTSLLTESVNYVLVDAIASSTAALDLIQRGDIKAMTTLTGSGYETRIPAVAEEIQTIRMKNSERAASTPRGTGKKPRTVQKAKQAAREAVVAGAAENSRRNDEILNRVLGEKPETPPSTTPAVGENITATEANTVEKVKNTAATQAATTTQVEDKTVTKASTTATELKTTATNASAATIIMSKRGEELMNKANALLTSAKFQQVAAIDALISSYTAEQLSTKSGASLVKARDGVRSSLNTLEKAKAELLKREAATIKNGLGAQNSALVDAKKKLEIATKNASKRLTDLAKASTVMTDSLKATTVTPVTAKPAKAAPAATAAAKAAAPFYPTPTGAPIPKASTKVNLGSLPGKMKIAPTDSGVIKKLGELAVSFDKSLANFFKGPNFFQGPNIFQGKIISADKLKINITDKARDASRLASARSGLAPYTDPLVVRASRRKTLGEVRKKILDDGGTIDDVRAAKLRRITGIDPRRTVGATSPVPMTRPVFGPALPKPPLFPTPTGAAIPSRLKSTIDDITKGVTKLGSMFSNVLPKAMHVTATAAVKSFTAVGRAVTSSYAVNAVKAMTGGLKVVGSTADMLADGFRKSAGAVRVFNAINNATITTIKSMGAAGLVTKTITSDMAWAFGKLGKILGSTVNVEMKAFLISLQRSKLTKAWTFMLTAGMMTFVKSLRVGIAHLNIFSNTGARLASAKAAINGLTAGTSLLRKSLVGLNAFTGLSAGIQAAFSGILKSVLSVVSIVIKLNAALFLIAPVVLLISAIFIQLKRGTTNNSAALKLFKEGIVLIKGAVLALANPILDIINAFGGFTGATNQTQKTAGALYMMARAFKSVSQAFNNFAQGAGQRFVKNTLGPVIIRLVNRFILLGRAIRGAMRQDGSAGKNMSAFFQSLLYEGLNVMAKLFDGLSKLLPHMGGIIGSVIGAVAKASIKMLNLIGKFGMEVGLFFGSIISGIGLAMMAIPGIGTALGATIAAAGAALVGVSLAGFAASKALVKSDAEIDKWASGVGKSVANGMGSAASGMAGFIRKGMDSIDKSYAKKIGQGINKALVSTAGDPDGLKKAIEESLKKNADVAKSGGEALGTAVANGMKKKMQDIKKTFTDGFFGKADAAVDRYVDSLRRGLEDQRDQALEAFDNQADAIQELADAEERLTSKIEYEEKKRLLIKTRALDQENYLRERKVAVYEGRTEDVRSLDLASQKSKTESTKEESDLDLSRLRTLQGEQRDRALAVIAKAKDDLAKEYERMFRDFDTQIENIQSVGFSTEEEFRTLLSRLGSASQTFSDAITDTFSDSMVALPSAIREHIDPSIGMFTVTMDKLVAEAQGKFGAANGTANSTSILGAAYNLATGMPDAFKTAFNDGIIAQFVTPWSSAVTAEISGIIPSNLWVESAGLALIEMVNTLKRELVALKGTLWNDFKKIFEATSDADFASIFGPALAGLEDVKKYMTGLFGEVTQLASDINLIEINREQQSGGGGDEAKKPAGGALPGEASYVPSAYDRFEIRRGRGLADRSKITPPASDSGAEKSGGGFFGGIKDAAVGLADQLGAVKTAILGAVGAIAGFFVLQAVFGFISTAMGVIAGAFLTASIGVAAVVAAVGIVIGLFIYLYIKVKGFRDFVNGAFIAAWEALGAVIGFVWDGIKTGVSAAWDAIKDFAQNTWNFMKDVWDAIGGIVVDTFKKIISFFVDGFNALKDNIGGFVDSYINLFKGFWGAIWDGIKTIADPIMELLGKIGIAIGIAIGAIVAFAGGIVVVIVNIFDKIKGPLFSVTGFVIDIFSKIFDIATPIVEIGIGIIANLIALPFKILNTVIDIAVGAIKIAIDIIVGVFNILFDVFKAIASNPIVVFFARVVAGLTIFAAIIATWGVKFAFELIADTIQYVYEKVKALADAIWDTLGVAFSWLGDKISTVWNAISDTWNKITAKFREFKEWFNANFGSLWNLVLVPFVLIYEGIRWVFNYVKEHAGPIIREFWQDFKDRIDAVWDKITAFADWVSNIFSAVWENLGPIISALWDGLKKSVDVVWEILKAFASWLNDKLGGAWNAVSDIISKVWDKITSGITLVKDKLIDLRNWLLDKLGMSWEEFKIKAYITFLVIKRELKKVYDKLRDFASWLKDKLSGAWDAVSEAAGKLWDLIQAGWDKVGPILGWMYDKITDLAGAIYDKLKPAFEKIGPVIETLWELSRPIFEGIGGLLELLGHILNDLVIKPLQALWDLIVLGWNLVKPVFEAMWDWLGPKIGPLIDYIKEGFHIIWDTIGKGWTWVKDIFSDMYNWLKDKIGSAVSTLADLWDKVWDSIGKGWDWVKGIFSEMYNWLNDKIAWVINNIKELWDKFVQKITDTWNGLVEIFAQIGQKIKNAIGGAIENIVGAWDSFTTKMGEIWRQVKTIATNIGDYIKDKIGGAINFISDLIGLIPATFKGVMNVIINGWNGIWKNMDKVAFPKSIWGIPLPPFMAGKSISDYIDLPLIAPMRYNGGKIGTYMMGGMAYGTGGMTNGPVQQGIPAILHGGEYVINHKAVQRIGTDTLDRLNNYKLSKPNLPSMPSVPRINMPGAGMNAPQYAQSGSSSTQNVNIFVENFIGEPEWFNGMMKDYNTKILPRNQKAAGVQSRVVSTYNGINKGL